MPIPVRFMDDTAPAAELHLGKYRTALVLRGIPHWLCLEVSSRSMLIPVRFMDDTVPAGGGASSRQIPNRLGFARNS
jgi:hypothetical protein